MATLLLGGLVFAACRQGRDIPLPRKVIDLTPAVARDVNAQRLGARALKFLGLSGAIQVESILPEDPDFAFGLEMFHLPSHTGAHLDAPARLLRGGDPPGRVSLTQLVGPIRLIDLRWHDRHSAIEISDLELGGVSSGDVVVLFVGYEPPVGDEWPVFSSLSRQAAEWLVAKEVRALATDAPAIVGFSELEARMRHKQPPAQVWEEYLPFFRARIPIIAGLANLAALADEQRVVFVALPLAMADGTGAPLRAAALVY